MRILLISPSEEKVYGVKSMPAYPSLGLLYIGTVLQEEGHEIRLLDIDTEKINDRKFCRVFQDFNPDAVGITSVTPTINDALKWAALSKTIRDIPVVLGGIHATIAPEEVIRRDCVDIVVAGEGELTAMELFQSLSTGQPGLKDIKGIFYKLEGRMVVNERRPLIEDLDLLPFPDRTLLKRPEAFLPPDATVLPVATIMTTRGCPGNCTFCCTRQIFSRKLRARSVRNMVEEVENLVREGGFKEIHVADDTFTLVKERVLAFCDEIKKRKLKVHFQFMNGLRADFVDREILSALRDTGFTAVGYGVETGNEGLLKNIKKNIPLEVTRNAFRISKELSFETWAFLIFGLPGETEETIKQTIRFTKELDPDFAKFFILKPYPGTEVHAYLEKENLLLSRDYDYYGLYSTPVHKLPGLDPERIVYWQKRAFREFYLRPQKVISHLKRIRSRDQVKLIINDFKFALHCMFKRNKN